MKLIVEGLRPSVPEKPGSILIPLFAGADPSAPLIIFASFSEGTPDPEEPSRFRNYRDLAGIYISHDGGDNWSLFSRHLQHGTLVAVNPYDPRHIIGVTEAGVVYSSDRGLTWNPIPQQQLLELPATPGSRKLLKSTPASEEEKEYRAAIIKQRQLSVFQVMFTSRGDIYLLSNKGLFYLRSHQNAWVWFDLGNNRLGFANSMALNPANESEIFVGTDEGVLRSTNGGCTFQRVLR
ncbi:MAG TPA: hypothetical protein VFP59_03200 [Candidatus Angelobacter sp.]|nr:hypothetical protein [Candidatus Angelobacter sp.]